MCLLYWAMIDLASVLLLTSDRSGSGKSSRYRRSMREVKFVIKISILEFSSLMIMFSKLDTLFLIRCELYLN